LQLEEANANLEVEPDNANLLELKVELESGITTFQALLEEERTRAPAPKAPSPPVVKEKWSKENHPAFKKAAPPPADDEPAAPIAYKVNDVVLAKWKTGDKSFYPAKILSITGSSTSPTYHIKFTQYNETETLAAHEIKPISNDSKKRKADGSPVTPTTPTTPATSGVISAAADINPALASQAKKEPSKVSDGPPKPAKIPRKVKANKELESNKNKWQQFAASGKGMKKKESMFRTGASVTARVGFTGSGQEMRKDPTRSRHIYQTNEDEE
ncbi:Splicing factor spf30, partial [Diplodia seriata]